MGQKQQAFINDLAAKQTACDLQITAITDAIAGIVDINNKITAEKDWQKQKKLKMDKNPHYGEMLKAKTKLTGTLIPAFDASIKALDDFAKKKSKRWFGKSTLKDATQAVSDAKAHSANMKQFCADTVNVM